MSNESFDIIPAMVEIRPGRIPGIDGTLYSVDIIDTSERKARILFNDEGLREFISMLTNALEHKENEKQTE